MAKFYKMADSVNEKEIDKVTEKHGRNLSFHAQVCFLCTLQIVLHLLYGRNSLKIFFKEKNDKIFKNMKTGHFLDILEKPRTLESQVL